MKTDDILKNKILNEWNNTDEIFSEEKTIHQLFEENVAVHPNHIALISTENVVSYKELNDKANRIARGLKKHGVKPNSFVGILLPRSCDLIASLLGILKNGGAYIPLNLNDPAERILKICQTAGIEYIITTNEFENIIRTNGEKIIIDQLLTQSEALSIENINNNISPDDPAYIIFTSGTTGTPKGVLVKHKPVINLIEWVNKTFNVTKSDKLLWTTNLSFDLSVYDIFGILAAGGTIRILSDSERLDAEKQLNIMLEEGITFWDSAPQSLQRIMPYLPDYKSKVTETRLRLVFLSGDWIPLHLPDEVRSLFTKAKIVGLGGATEATVWSNYFVVDKIDPNWKSIPYGKPIQNAKYYILNEKLEHCGVLTPGDLYIGGKCLSSGYYNDKDLTDKKFIDDPYNPEFKLYFTGDKAQWMPDGNIEFLGREDLQVKVRGYRVELGEIKQAALSVKNIKDCVIVPDKSDIHNIKIFLYYIPVDPSIKEEDILKEELIRLLPDYMVPSAFFALENFPMTSNGKIDVKTLLEIAHKPSISVSSELLQNFDGIYKTLFDLWSGQLGFSEFSINDSFNSIGGDSLFVYRLINMLKEKHGYDISFRDLNSNSSIKLLGDFLLSQHKSPQLKPIDYKGRKTRIPLSSHQERIWLNSKLNPNSVHYNLSFVFKLSGELDIDIFIHSLEILFERHETFYSSIKEIENDPYIDIIPHKIHLHYLDYSNKSEAETEHHINNCAVRETNIYNEKLYSLYLIKNKNFEYLFQLNVHHIIFDGLSLQIFVKDLGLIYNSLLLKKDYSLPPLKLSQGDFAQWEKDSLNVDLQNKYLEYWKQKLAGVTPILNFPYDNPRSNNPTGLGNRVPYVINNELSEKLNNLSKKCDCSLFSTMLSFYSILIHKYTSDNDFCIGVPVSYRPDANLENIIGMFVNTLALRFTFNNHLTAEQIILQTKADTIDAISNQAIPFEKIVNTLNPERINNVNPIFQVSFAWQENMDVSFEFKNIQSTRIPIQGGVSPFDISLYMWEDSGNIKGEFEYNTDILNFETIKRLKDSFLYLIEQLISKTNVPLTSISIVSEKDRELLESLTNSKVDYPKQKTIVQIFEEQVLNSPDKPAVVFNMEVLTYKQLNQKANQLAYTLRELGVTRNSSVGILVDKSIEMVIGILGIVKAGGAYLAIDPEYPENRINFILNDGGCNILLTQKHLMELKIERVTKLDLNSDSSYYNNTANLERINSSEDLAYIIYTSGSTGNPKGSLIRHFSIVRTVINPNYMKISQEARLLYTSAIVFDVTTFEIWGPLLNGATVYVIEKETLLNPPALDKELKDNKITILHLTSALFTQIAEITTDIFSDLEYLMIGGDALSAQHVNKVRTKIPHLKILNCYGPSENTTFSTIYEIEREHKFNVPIGKPINNSTAYVFDKSLNYQPIGVIGELYVGGDGLSKEYLNREDLNKTSFITHPHKPNERLYKTGDLVRWLPDGNLEFHGRIDKQIKVRGFRVELDEIESTISEINEVIETVVKPIKLQEGDYKLVAFLNVTESFSMSYKEVENEIKSKLPSYMVPSGFKFMNGFPKTTNGKIDRKALNLDLINLDEKSKNDSKFLTKTEELIYTIWCEALKISNFSIDDNFFDIGGNSLLSLRCINKMNETFSVNLTFREFIADPKVGYIAGLIDSLKTSFYKRIELKHTTSHINLPLTNNQKRIWLISKLNPDVPLYIIPYTIKFTGTLNINIFQKSINLLFERHYILFSIIKESEGEPFLDINFSKITFFNYDLTTIPKNEINEKVNNILKEDSKKAFNLNKGPLFRMYLIKVSPKEYYFHFSIHHIIFDAWSWFVISNDLNKIYNSLLKNEEIVLEELKFQQFDFAKWEKKLEGSKEEKESVDFWRKNLEDPATLLNFPYDYPRKEKSLNLGSYEDIVIQKDISNKLKTLSKNLNTSLFSTVLSVFGIQLHKYSGDYDLNIGLPVTNRPDTNLEKIAGMFVNTVVVRLKYMSGQTFKDAVRQANESALSAITNQILSFDKVVELINPNRMSNVNPLFQAAFVWQNEQNGTLSLEGIECERVGIKDRSSAFDISLIFWEENGLIKGEIEYNTDILKQETILRMRENFLFLLEKLVTNPETPIDTISLITDQERAMIDGFNNTRTEYPRDKTIIELIEGYVKLQPDKTAVVFKERSLTYKQLNERVNQLARKLREAGTKANSPIGILVDRSVEMIIGMLGILKAGGAYVPLDPEYPEQRKNFIIRDSGCEILVTHDKYIPEIKEQVTLLSLDQASSYHNNKSDLEKINTSSDLAYILYTSGTTGMPKGTLIPQKGVVRLVCNTNYVEFKREDRILQSTAIVFDASTVGIFGALLNGATLYLVDKETVLNPNALGEELLTNNITITDFPTPLFTQIAEVRTDIFRTLRILLIGGDILSVGHINKVRKDNPNLTIINEYGPTENSCNSTAFIIDRDFAYNIPIGKPISNSTAYIFDNNMNYQPIGVVGELYVGGDGLSLGYLNRDELNRTCFVKHPSTGERLYKTGDLARWLPDGNIEFHGRMDNQIKIRGFRVELGEIEAVLCEIEGIISAVVKPIKVDAGDTRLVAFLDVPSGTSIDPDALNTKAREKLPPYMIPAAYKTVNGFPLTVNGKIDKKALVFDIEEFAKAERNESKELTDTERTLINIWSDVLKTKNILSTDNFFDIGGNSLLAITLTFKIEKVFHIEFNIRTFFSSPRIKDLAELIDLKVNFLKKTNNQNINSFKLTEGEI